MALPIRDQLKYWGIAGAIFLVILWFTGDVLLPFLIGAAIAYFLDPVADRLECLGLSRAMATTVITLVAILIFVVMILLVVPTLVNQAVNLFEVAPELGRNFIEFITDKFPTLLVEGSTLRNSITSLATTVQERGGELVQVSEMPLLRVAAREGTQAGDQVAGALEMLGYEAFDFSMRGESVYDAEADRMYTRGENYLRLEDGFEIRFDQDFSGIEAYMERYGAAMADMFDPAEGAKTPDALSPAQMDPALKAAYEPLMLNRMRIAIEDRSLLDRALDAAATRQNVDPATVRSQMIGMLGMGVMMAPPEIPRPLVGSVSQALTLFLQEGGTVVISADPEEPVSIGRIIEASEEGRFDPAMLNVTVRHEGEDEE